MIDVVSVKFKGRGKTYFFDPNGIDVPEGATVVVETSKGLELADCVAGNHTVTDERIVPPLRPVVRIATADDMRIAELCKTREKEAFAICEEKIAEHGLDMKLVDVECNFEGSKMLFFFTSDGRVDFRELVKDLAGIFRTRIELRQIGVRDEAKMLGGLGICGRPYCCHQFLDDFEPVSTKMAKTQSLSLNPSKISGSCGRLMCCLRYEQEAYEDLVKTVPKNGAFVETPKGYGNIAQVNLLRQSVKVRLDGDAETLHSFDADEVAAVPGGRPKPGEPLPHVLEPRKKEKHIEEDEPKKDDMWVTPLFAEDTAGGNEDAEEPGAKKTGRRRSRQRSGKKNAPEAGREKAQSEPARTEKSGNKSAPRKNRGKPAAAASGAGEDAGHNRAASGESGKSQRRHNRKRYQGKPKNKNHSPSQNSGGAGN